MRKIIRTNAKELGELRTSLLITSFGVGAIVDFRDETAILGGADDWYRDPENDKERVLRCHNLEKILDKEFFVKPKCDKKQRAIYKRSYSHDIGAYRFPSMLYCPSCAHLCSEKELAGLQNVNIRSIFGSILNSNFDLGQIGRRLARYGLSGKRRASDAEHQRQDKAGNLLHNQGSPF